MYTMIFLIQYFPFWSVPAILLSLEIARFYRRRRNPIQYVFLGLPVILVGLLVMWGVMRGDLHADAWVRDFFDTYGL